jgi:hypothetical protein
VYISLSDCKDGRYHEHLRNSIIGPLQKNSAALDLTLSERIDALLNYHKSSKPTNLITGIVTECFYELMRRPVTLVIDDAHLAYGDPSDILVDQDGNSLQGRVRAVFVNNKTTSHRRYHYSSTYHSLDKKHSLDEKHRDRERILHTLKRRMNIDEPHLDQIVSAVGVSLKDIDAVMHNVKQLMPAGSPVSARPTTEMVSSAIDDVLKTRYQELRSVADQLTDDSRTGTGTGTDAGTDAGTIN